MKPKTVMFWSPEFKPSDYVGQANEVSDEDRKLVARFFKKGKVTARYKGMATCRYEGCSRLIGSTDMMNGHYIYPAKCWHYIEEHDVWTDELAEVLSYLKEEWQMKTAYRIKALFNKIGEHSKEAEEMLKLYEAMSIEEKGNAFGGDDSNSDVQMTLYRIIDAADLIP